MNQRLQIVIRGAVQGVGFRPFIYRLAVEMNLTGWIINSSQGVFIEAEGKKESLENFILRIGNEKPPISYIQSFEYSYLDPIGYTSFEIKQSRDSGKVSALILPDIATCSDCVAEIFDPNNRRFYYPFTNCTNCGPRFSIIEKLPYDRPNTSMKHFIMCEECLAEYQNPADRRFHAQPNACPKCGPRLELWNQKGEIIADVRQAIIKAVEFILAGKIVAVKGIGGFHLMVDSANDESIKKLRYKKNREEKPFALMFPSMNLINSVCDVSNLESRLLASPEAPIVLLKKKTKADNINIKFSDNIAPKNPYLGIMLPYTPLHHVMMKELKTPVIATSGNYSDEPICTDEFEALKRLKTVADYFLVHNRKIIRHVDDSIARILNNREFITRRARGYAPLPVQIRNAKDVPLLAVGAHQKNSIALKTGNDVFISQHIGDLETPEAFSSFKNVIKDFENIYDSKVETLVADLHPDYSSTRFATETKKNIIHIQHHFAHIMSCMAENQLQDNVLGISWDGSGFGTDDTIWGGEFLLVEKGSFKRIATFRNFKLPGGDRAIKEPRRVALSLMKEIFGSDISSYKNFQWYKSFPRGDANILEQMILKNVNTPSTSSVGRLFDGVASIVGIKNIVSFEGQAAMELEFSLDGVQTDEYYPWKIHERKDRFPNYIIDWEPIIKGIVMDLKRKIPIPFVSAKFHNTLVETILDVATRAGESKIVLSGGCFQNVYLAERAVLKLREKGFKPYWHQRIPTNDGGIALGQIMAAQFTDV